MLKSIPLWGLVLFLAAALPPIAAAQSNKKYVQFNATHSFANILKQAMTRKARIILHLRSGKTLGGRVAGVGANHVVLKGLARREFYDAIVRLNEIAAIEARARDK